jgi:hypothetical protein
MSDQDQTSQFLLVWHDSGREPQNPPNPAFPDGITPDLSNGKTPSCRLTLPYPSPRVGGWLVTCKVCLLRVGITAAGRADDPRGMIVACKRSTTH